MTAATLTLTDFLLARIAEDEAVARAGVSSQADPENGWGYRDRALTPHVGIIHEPVQAAHIIRWHPYRVLAECEAKRRIVANTVNARTACGQAPMSEQISSSDGPAAAYWRGQDWVCRVLALSYASHVDYDPRWRPYGDRA